MATDLIVHWLHVMAAILWVGGNVTISLLVQPVLRRHLEPGPRLMLYREIGRRFTWVQWGSWAVLLATGGHKLWGLRTTPEIFHGLFGKILSVKLALVVVMGALSLLHTYRWGPRLIAAGPAHPDYGQLVRRVAFWGRVNLAAILGIVLLGVSLRYHPW